MKIYLPHSLRAALLGGVAVTSTLFVSSVSGSLLTGLVVYTVSSSLAQADWVGSGTEDDPYIVDEASELSGGTDALLYASGSTSSSAGKYYVIDISTTSYWTRICDAESLEIVNWEISGSAYVIYTLNCDITGSGNILIPTSSANTRELYFTGDLSEWSGNLGGAASDDGTLTSKAYMRLFFQGEGERYAASGTGTVWTDKYIYYSVDNSDGSTTNIANESITAYQIYIGNSSGVETNAYLRSNTSLTGSGYVLSGASLTLTAEYDGDNITLSGTNFVIYSDAYLGIEENQTLAASDYFLAESGSTVENSGIITVGGAFTVEGEFSNAGSLTLSSTATVSDGATLLSYGELNINGSLTNEGTIVLGGSLALGSAGSVTNNGTIIFDVNSASISLDSLEAGTYSIFTNGELGVTNFTEMTQLAGNLDDIDAALYRATANEDGTVTIIEIDTTLSISEAPDSFTLADATAIVEGSTFYNTNNLVIEGMAGETSSATVSGAVDISKLTLGENVSLSLSVSDADSSLIVYAFDLAAGSTLSVSDVSLTNWGEGSTCLTADSSSTIIFTGTGQDYDVGATLNTFTGTIVLTESNTLSLFELADGVSLNLAAGTTLAVAPTDTIHLDFAVQSNHSFTGANLQIVDGDVSISNLATLDAEALESTQFATITIDANGGLEWGANNGVASVAESIIFNGGDMYTAAATSNANFNSFVLTENGGSVSFSTSEAEGGIYWTINEIEGSGSGDAFEIYDLSESGDNVLQVSISALTGFNGTLSIEGFEERDSSKVYLSSISNSGGEYTQINGELYVAASSTLSIEGSAGMNNLNLEADATLDIAQDSSVSLSGYLSFAEGSSINNEGILSFDSDIQLDISDIVWSVAEDGTYSYQVLTGEGESNFAELSVENIIDADVIYTYSFSAEGLLSYIITGVVFDQELIELTTAEGSGFKNDYSVVVENATSQMLVGNASEGDDMSINELVVSEGVSLSVSKDADFSYGLNISSISLEEGASISFEDTLLSLGSLVSESSSGMVNLLGSGNSYNLSETDFSAFSGTISVAAGVELVVGADFNELVSLTPGDSLDDAASIHFTGSTTLSDGLIVTTSSELVDTGYISLDVDSGVNAYLTGLSMAEGTQVYKTGDGTLRLSGSATNTIDSDLYVTGGTVELNTANAEFNSITITNGAEFSIVGSWVSWASISDTIYLNNGTFSDVSGKTSVATPTGLAFVSLGGDNYFDMSGSSITYFVIEGLTGQGFNADGTRSSDGTFTVLGNSEVTGQYITLTDVTNFNGTYIAGGGASIGVTNITNAVGETTIFEGDFTNPADWTGAAQGMTVTALGSAVFTGSFTATSSITVSEDSNLSINDLSLITTDANVSNNGNLDLQGTTSFSADATIANAGTGTLSVSAVSVDDGVSASFTGAVSSEGLSKTGDGDVSFETLSLTGSLSITGDGSITITDSLSVGSVSLSASSVSLVQYASTLNESTTNNVTITSRDGSEATLSYEDGTLTNLSISNASITTDGDLILNSVDLSNSSITADNLTVNTGFIVSEDGLTYTVTALDGVTLDLTGDITLNITMTDEQLSSYESALSEGLEVSIVVESLASNIDSLASLTVNNYDLDIEGLTIDGTDIVLPTDIIPEPSTTALSLLALAGLLARRRRKNS